MSLHGTGQYAWCPSTAAGRGIDLVAARWTLEQSAGAVVMSDVHLYSEAPVLAYFPKARRWTRRARVSLDRAVLIYEATWAVLGEGLSRVQGDGCAAVLELPSCPMLGWARAVGALNLATGDTESALPDDVAEAAETIAGLSYNSLGAEPAKRAVPRVLADLHQSGSLTWEFPSAVLAFAPRSGHSMDVLTKQVERLIGQQPIRHF